MRRNLYFRPRVRMLLPAVQFENQLRGRGFSLATYRPSKYHLFTEATIRVSSVSWNQALLIECVGVDTLTWRVVFGLVVVSVVVELVILEATRNQSRPSRLFLMLNPGHANVKPCQRVILDGIYSHGYVSFTTDPAKGPGRPLVNASEMFVPGFLISDVARKAGTSTEILKRHF